MINTMNLYDEDFRPRAFYNGLVGTGMGRAVFNLTGLWRITILWTTYDSRPDERYRALSIFRRHR